MDDIAAAQLKEQILEYSRQNTIGELSPLLSELLTEQIKQELFLSTTKLCDVADMLVARLVGYRTQCGVSTAIIGMSGGVDSALTAALFKKAGWRVIGVTMPIHQVQAETDRGVEACKALSIKHIHKDLSDAYEEMLRDLSCVDINLILSEDEILWRGETLKSVNIRRGNIRARLRMITLYNLASLHGGLVASTDNFSELAAGFWTLHGDVGDVSPIQGLFKSWEVPYIASIAGVPEATWRAKPTDGLGIDAGDEAQLGCSYLEWDIMMNCIMDYSSLEAVEHLFTEDRAKHVFECVKSRLKGTWFKRKNPFNFDHPVLLNISALESFESLNTVPVR